GGLAAAGGSRGAGMAALAKVLAVCAGAVGGAACVATGVVPAPLLDPPDHYSKPAAKVAHHRRALADEEATQPTVQYETEPPSEAESETAPQERDGQPEETEKEPKHEGPQTSETAAASTPPPSESGATEYVEPAPAPAPSSTATSSATSSSSASSSSSSSPASSGTAAGEFGP
ncbi:MAG TPA: hypothetical protein VJL81_17030, partial [Solirubrobacterales bacterium]|nr:hypothetical protein [Solirubrobacterales bacterium]